jgi:tryptophanyl-tRNA synthetase
MLIFRVAPSRRILSLRDPTSKMSKSSPDVQSRILLTDSTSEIKSKIQASVTDSILGVTYDPVNRPGTSNLLTILAACTDESPEEVASRYEGKSHRELKADTADAVEELLKGPREDFERIRNEKGYLTEIAKQGAERAKERSSATLKEVRTMVGLS